MPEHAPAGDRATADAFRERFTARSSRIWSEASGFTQRVAVGHPSMFTRRGGDQRHPLRTRVHEEHMTAGYMLSVRQIKARGDFEEAIRAALTRERCNCPAQAIDWRFLVCAITAVSGRCHHIDDDQCTPHVTG